MNASVYLQFVHFRNIRVLGAIMRSGQFITLLVLILCTTAKGQSTLSPSTEISVITIGPTQTELYSAFGHSAIRVYDPGQGMDEAYNWGLFDFDQPNFYLNFAKGYLYYRLGVHPYSLFRDHYIYYNRYVHEQPLDLTLAQKQKLYDYLVWNNLPENQHYRYDYFYNNCATKVRDVLTTVFGDSVVFDGSYIKTEYSIRDLTDIYLPKQPWGDLGIDICLGLPMDKKASPNEYMFLPDYIEAGFNHASINGHSLVKETISVYESREEETPKSLIHPLTVFIGFAVLTLLLTLYDWKRKQISRWFDALLFGVLGLVGLLLFFLWFFTDHQAAAVNFNLLWALPTHLIAAIALFKNRKWVRTYFLVNTAIALLTLLCWPVLPQALNVFLIPLVVAILLRSVLNHQLRKS